MKPGGPPVKVVAGKVNLVVFWATWSGPDRQELVKLEEIWKRDRDRGLAIAALSIDDDLTYVPRCVQEVGATYDVGWDTSHEIANRFVISSDPTTFVVDKAGIVRFIHQGFHDGEDMDIVRETESLL